MKSKFLMTLKNAGIGARAAVCSGILAVQTGVMSGLAMAGGSIFNDDESALTNGGIKTNLNGGNLVGQILDKVVNIFILMGAFFIVSGIWKLVMAYKDNQPEQQNAAVRDIVIGAVMVVFRVFLWKPIAKLIFSQAGA